MAPKHLPKREQKQKAKSGGTSSPKTSEKEELVQARAVKRAERVEARRVQAEKRKEAGNTHFRAGNYRKAIEEYNGAIKTHGPSAAYMSNMAAAWLKLKEYDTAERCADRALVLDPRFMKARYRRGLARKGNLEFARAAVDFQTVLTQDPDSTEAKEELRETYALMIKRIAGDDTVDWKDESPQLDDTKLELESISDSSDWNHEGNGIPCRFYNHDGCLRRTVCRYSHAPDHKSVRDRLGRNVCVYFLLGNCKFGGSACVYSHDETYLPSGRWWEDEGKCDLLRDLLEPLDPDATSAGFIYTFALIDKRLAWAPGHGVEMEELYGHDISLAELGFHSAARNAAELVSDAQFSKRGVGSSRRKANRAKGRGEMRGRRAEEYDEFDSDEDEAVDNFGFTQDDLMELAIQGVKPWDDDAWDVLNALYTL